MAITEFILFVLTATLGGMFLCGANDLITIFVAPECFSGRQPFINIVHQDNKKPFSYPYESDNTMLFPLLVLVLFTLFVGFLGIPFNQEGTGGKVNRRSER
ncbi:hypothetical protein CASFOL_007662 [Castilleja foliolosa]|uniref:NAD(P)H-quinone oxidoreductase subunit 5, chloroplastic n=1 Tax=Castilleja foliolosa TaxID=1961234 RepID=A0ABD3E140_9LAMI